MAWALISWLQLLRPRISRQRCVWDEKLDSAYIGPAPKTHINCSIISSLKLHSSIASFISTLNTVSVPNGTYCSHQHLRLGNYDSREWKRRRFSYECPTDRCWKIRTASLCEDDSCHWRCRIHVRPSFIFCYNSMDTWLITNCGTVEAGWPDI